MRDDMPDVEYMDELPELVSMWAAVAGARLEDKEEEEIVSAVRGKPNKREAVIEELRRRNLLPAKKEDWMRW